MALLALIISVLAWLGVSYVAFRARRAVWTVQSRLDDELRAIHSRVDELHLSVESLGSKLQLHSTAIQRAEHGVTDTARRVAAARREVHDANHRVVVLREQTDERFSANGRLSSELRTGVQDAKDRILVLREQTDERFSAHARVTAEMRAGIQDAKDRTGVVRSELNDDVAELTSSLLETDGRIAESERRAIAADRAMRTITGAAYHRMSRGIDEAEEEALLATASDLGIGLSETHLAYLVSKVRDTEQACRGRIAAPAATVVARSLACLASKSSDLRVLEIGTLHGIAAAYLHNVLEPRFGSFHQTLIDPFFGYYGHDELDLVTPVPVAEDIARGNLRQVGAAASNFEIVTGLSESPEVRLRLRERQFDVVIIDGDHSYDGVHRDFDNYADHLQTGGLLVVDDYRGPSWPEVTRFVDDVICGDPRFDFLSGRNQTAIFRRR